MRLHPIPREEALRRFNEGRPFYLGRHDRTGEILYIPAIAPTGVSWRDWSKFVAEQSRTLGVGPDDLECFILTFD